MSKKINFKLGGAGASTGAIYLMAVKFVTIALGIVISRILSEYLSKYDYGTYSQIMLVVSTVTSFTILGMADAVNFFFCKESDEKLRESYVSTIFSLQYCVGIIAAALLMICYVPLCRYFENNELKPLVFIAAALPMLQNLISMLQVLFVSIGKSRSIAIRNLIVSILKLGIVSLACIALDSVAIIIAATLVIDIAQVVFFISVLRKNGCIISLKQTRAELIKPILNYSIPMAAFIMISTLTRDMDKYVISYFTDTETLAVYTNAAKVLPFDIVMSSFCTVLLPYITNFVTRKHYDRATALYGRFIKIAYVSTAVLAGAALVSARELMTLLYTEEYLDGLGVFCIYIIVDIFRFTNITLVLSAAGKTKNIMFISILGFALNFVLNILLYSVFGLEGPAISTLIVTLFVGALILIYGAKVLRAKITDLFDFKHIMLFSLEFLITGGTCIAINYALSATSLHYILVMLISSGIFALAMLLMNAKSVIKIIKEIERAKMEA